MAAIPARKILSVAQVNRLVAGMLDEYFSDIWIMGEISNFKAYPSGHLYFVLKDEESQIQAVCFRDSARRLKFQLEDGLLVIGHGRLEVYVPNGKYQIILDTIEPKGLGALQKAFEQLKRKLEKEGLFRPERKRSLPKLPRVVGLVTSPAGAAIHDIIKTLRLHRAHIKVLLYPIQVQGEGAAEQIAEAIMDLNKQEDVEVLILARGGGSLEDLWPFNEEMVARAIAASRVPVVTGIGHEVDFTIADFVADVRAATPTAAAQLIARGWEELEQKLNELNSQMVTGIQEVLFNNEQKVEELSRHRAFEFVQRQLREAQYQTEMMQSRIVGSINQSLTTSRTRLSSILERLSRQSPATRTLNWRLRLSELAARMERSVTRYIGESQNQLSLWNSMMARSITAIKTNLNTRLERMAGALNALSPLASLARGYCICQKGDGRVVKSIGQVMVDEGVFVRLSDGKIKCDVREKMGGENGQ